MSNIPSAIHGSLWHSRLGFAVLLLAVFAVGIGSALSPNLVLFVLAVYLGIIAFWITLTHLEIAGVGLLASMVIPVSLFQFGGRTFFLHELALLVVVAGWLVRVCQHRVSLAPLKCPEGVSVLILGLIYIASFIRVPDWNVTFGEYGGIKELYRIALSILGFLVFSTIFSSHRRTLDSIRATIVAGLVPVLVGVYLFLTSGLAFAFGSSLVLFGGEEVAAQSLPWSFLASVGYRVSCGALLCAVAGLFVTNTSKRSKTVLGVILLIMVQQVIFVGDRGAWLAVGLTLVILFVSSSIRAKGIYVSFGIALLIVSTVLVSSVDPSAHPVLGVLATFTDPNDPSVQGRLFLWRLGVEQIAANPVLGIGLSQFSVRYLDLAGEQGRFLLGPTGIAVHNLYIDIGLSAGLLGLSFFLKVAWDGLRRGFYLLRMDNGEARQISQWAFALILYYLMKGLTDVPLSITFSSLLFFSVLGIMNATFYRASSQVQGSEIELRRDFGRTRTKEQRIRI